MKASITTCSSIHLVASSHRPHLYAIYCVLHLYKQSHVVAMFLHATQIKFQTDTLWLRVQLPWNSTFNLLVLFLNNTLSLSHRKPRSFGSNVRYNSGVSRVMEGIVGSVHALYSSRKSLLSLLYVESLSRREED